MDVCMCASCACLFYTSWTVALRALQPWNFPGKSTEVGCHFLLQGIFPPRTPTHISYSSCQFSQFSHSVVSDSLWPPWIAAHQASLSITNSRSSLRLTPTKSVMPSSHLILCRPLLLLPPVPPSIRAFSSESTCSMRWPEYWSFSFTIIPSKEIPGLISFRMDWLDLLAIQGTVKSLLQDHSLKASVLRHSAFFMVNSHIHTWPQEKP